MKKLTKIISIVSFSILLIASVAVMAKGPSGQAGNSNIGHLYLWEKNPAIWQIIEDGSWGKMKYNLSGEEFEFVFNGHSLQEGAGYTLIYYPDPWPGQNLICLGSDTVNNGGNVHIKESVDTCDLPSEDDANYPDGAKVWLVLSEDVDCQEKRMVGWNPTEYLFEYQLILFDDTDCGGENQCMDNDQDGYYGYDEINCPEGDDCDDLNPEINPGVTEDCYDGLDNDCDGYADWSDEDCPANPD
jgi:hypothetical protein